MIRLRFFRENLFLLTWWKETLIFTDYGNDPRSSEPICMYTLTYEDWEKIKKICSSRYQTLEIPDVNCKDNSYQSSKDFSENLNHLLIRGKIVLRRIEDFYKMVKILEENGFKVIRYLGSHKYKA